MPNENPPISTARRVARVRFASKLAAACAMVFLSVLASGPECLAKKSSAGTGDGSGDSGNFAMSENRFFRSQADADHLRRLVRNLRVCLGFVLVVHGRSVFSRAQRKDPPQEE